MALLAGGTEGVKWLWRLIALAPLSPIASGSSSSAYSQTSPRALLVRGRELRQAIVGGEMETRRTFLQTRIRTREEEGEGAVRLLSFLPLWLLSWGTRATSWSTPSSRVNISPAPCPPLHSPAMHSGTHRSHECRFSLCVTLAEGRCQRCLIQTPPGNPDSLPNLTAVHQQVM